jgi:hypothetical protein
MPRSWRPGLRQDLGKFYGISTIKAKPVHMLCGPMTKRKFPRIEIDQRAYDALQAEGILRHRTIREIATEAIFKHISKEALEFIDHGTIETECSTKGEMVVCKQKRKRLKDNLGALAKIKVMWNSGQKNQAEIARAIGYSGATVAKSIKSMKDRGELV